jgi:basic membrane protein A
MAGLLGAFLLVLTACGDGNGTPPGGGDGGEEIKVGLIESGPINDQGFYQAGFEGLQRAADDFGVNVLNLENVPPPNGEQAYRDLVAQGADLVIGMGAEFEDGGVAVAPEFPDVQFVVMNGRQTLPNLATYQLREAQVAALAMYAAALTSPPSTTMGIVAGVEIPPHVLLRDAVNVTVALAEPSDTVVSTFTGDFNDVALGKEAALSQIQNGSTIELAWTGAAVEGVFDAVGENQDKGVKAISPLVDRCGTQPYFSLSAIANPGGLVYRVIKEFTSENFQKSGTSRIGLDDPTVVSVVACQPLDPAVQAKVDDMQAQLIAGTVPGLPEGV